MKKGVIYLLAVFIGSVCLPLSAQAADSFGFYCAPYKYSFEDGKHYMFTVGSGRNSCFLTIPSNFPVDKKITLTVYRGTSETGQTIGGASGYVADFVRDGQVPTDFGRYVTINQDTEQEQIIRVLPQEGDNFFVTIKTEGTPALTNIGWTWGAKPASEFDPVIIIPGILGSWNKNGTWVLDPMKHVYDNLINTFKANGYVENKNLFTLPYDWERSNVDTATLLKQKIDQVKTICSCSHVDLIAHSMGGLAASYYISSSMYQNDVDQFFMLGTPLAGSPKVYKVWEAGDIDFEGAQINLLISRIFNREAIDNGFGTIFDYIQKKPVTSIQELLPVATPPMSHDYLTLGSNLLHYPTDYPINTFLENLVGDPYAYYDKVNQKVQTYVVTGDLGATSTITGYVVKKSTQLPKWKDGEVVSTTNGQGDGTVPVESATLVSGPDANYSGVEHQQLASSSAAYIFKTLNNRLVANVVGKTYGPFDADISLLAQKIAPSPTEFTILTDTISKLFPDTFGVHRLLLLMLFSPIDLEVTDPSGKRIGKNIAGGADLNEIPNAVYSGPIGEHEYVMILDPLPGIYKVETVGTGNGTYTIASGLITQATSSISLIFGTTTLNQTISNTLTLSATSTAVILTPPPAATTSPVTPQSCVSDITAAYKNKWIGKKTVYEKLVFECKTLDIEIKFRDAMKKIPQSKWNIRDRGTWTTSINLTKIILDDMDLLAKDKDNKKDAVLLITKITTWFRNHDL